MKKKLIACFTVALVLLFLFVYKVGWSEILNLLLQANVKWLATSAVLFSAAMLIWYFNWVVVLSTLGYAVTLWKAFPLFLSASFFNNVTPFGQAGGEAATAYVLREKVNIPYERGLATAILLDVLGLFPFVAFAVIGIIVLIISFDLSRRAYFGFFAAMGLALLVMIMFYVFWRRRDLPRRIVVFLARPFYKLAQRYSFKLARIFSESYINDKLDSFYRTLDTISAHKGRFFFAILISTCGWLLFVASGYAAFRAVGLHLPFTVVLLILPVAQLANFLPLPGGIGGNEMAFTALIVLVGGSAVLASAGVLLFRFVYYWMITFIGGVITFYLLGSRRKVEELLNKTTTP